MVGTNRIIFVDESGDTNLPQSDIQPSFYTITAILIDGNKIDEYQNLAKKIVDSNASPGELKSSNIGTNLKRRQRILKEIYTSGFPFYTLVIDKRQIFKDSGLRYRPSFYKFLHRMFYSRLRKSLLSMEVIADFYGRTEFMQSFIDYIGTNGNLFDTIQFAPSSQEALLQIADVIAGSIRRVYEGEDPLDNLTILGYPALPIEEWPPNVAKFSEFSGDFEEARFDSLVRKVAVGVARDFVQKNIENTDQEMRGLAEVARFLLYNYHIDPTKYVLKKHIFKHLREVDIRINLRVILSKLRDHDLIICSTEKGVKIPYDSKDIHYWVDRVNSQVVPYLHRLELCRRHFLMVTKGELDIVEK